jgi:PAS domain S-box-containing protein
MQLENDQNLYNTVISAPIGICILDAATLTSEIVNEKFLEVAGKPYEAIFGQFYWDSFAEARVYYEAALDRVVKTGVAYHADEVELLLIRHGQPEMVFVTFVYSPIKNTAGQVVKVAVWVLENTTQVKARQQVEQANESLKASQENIRNMVLQAPVAMCIIGGDPLFVEEVNDLFLTLTGKKREAFDGAPYWEVNAEARAFYEPITDTVLQTGKTYHAREHEIQLIRNGVAEAVIVDFVYEPRRNADGGVTGIIIVATEVTDKVWAKKVLEQHNEDMAAANGELAASNEELSATNEELSAAQENLRQLFGQLELSEAQYRNEQNRLERFFMQAPAGICILGGPELTFELINPLYQQLFPGRNILGKPMLEAIPEVKGAPIWDILQDVYHSGKTFEGKELLIPLARTDNGPVEDRYFDFIYQARLNEQSAVDGILVFVIEVTSGVRTKLELQRAEQMLRFAIEAANIGTYILDSKTRTLIASPRLKEMFGFYPDEDMPYDAAVSNITDEFRQKVMDGVEAAFREGKDFDMDYQIRGYHDQQLRWVRAVGKIDASTYAGETIFSGALIDITDQKEDSEKHARLAAIVNSSDDTILSKTLHGIITSWNAAAERMFGYTREEAIGKHISLLIPPTHLKEEEFIIGQISQGNKVDHFETVRVAKDGRLIPISLTVSPIMDGKGNIIGASKIARDIIAQQEAQETAARLYEQVKILNDKKDEFIGLASHELKTPLATIGGYLQILSRINTDPNSKRFVDKTLQQLKKLTALVNDLLDVSKIEAGKLGFTMEPFDLKPLIDDAIELIQYSTNKYIISFNTQSEHCEIIADSQRIEQVLVNLLTNAIKYSPGADKVEVSLSCSATEATVSIRDYGLGIAADKLIQIFSRFYRVDDASPIISGLGIGLYLSHEIINRHNGKLWAESEPGRGSIFYFTLPIAGANADSKP